MSQTFGRTRWKRFAVVMVPTLAATAAIGVSIAQGALAASFSVSGTQFKVTADKLDGSGFTQYGTLDFHNAKDPSTGFPVAVSGFNTATINNLCQSVPISTPFGPYTLTIRAGQDATNPVKASQLFIDMTDLTAKTADFNKINIGVAAGGLTKGPTNPQDAGKIDPNGFAQEAEGAVLTDVEQTAWATSAGTFSLNGMNLHLTKGNTPCPSY